MPHQSAMYSAIPLTSPIHEMAGSDALAPQPQSPTPLGTGIMGYIRRSSVSKTGGVERYG